jgi:hypothetical protein
MMIPAKQLIKAGLKSIGANGLVNPDMECGCGIDDLEPCCGCINIDECVAANLKEDNLYYAIEAE